MLPVTIFEKQDTYFMIVLLDSPIYHNTDDSGGMSDCSSDELCTHGIRNCLFSILYSVVALYTRILFGRRLVTIDTCLI